MGIIRTFIERPIFLLMVELFLVVLGIVGYQRLGVDLFPDVEPTVITITTEYPGAGPEEIESLVTKIIEEEVNQIGGIERLVSTSRQGLSQIVVEFELHIDPKVAQMDVRDKVGRVRASLPDDIEEPLLQRLDFADKPILQIALAAKEGYENQVSEARLYKIADETIQPLLQQIDGVGQVLLFGGKEREIQVNLDLEKLKTWKILPGEVTDAIRDSNLNVPSGEFNEYPESRSIRVIGEFPRVSDIKSTVVKVLPGGRSVLVGDLANVVDTYKNRENFARLNGQPVVLIELKKVSDGNTVAISDKLLKELPKLNQRVPSLVELRTVYDGAKRIRMSLDDVIDTLILAGCLAVVVVFLFLGSFQSTFVTGISLPSVIITSFFALYIFGFTLNIMTLLGITLSVGLLLDDAIVVRENIWSKVERGMNSKKAAIEGVREVYVAVIATSLTVLAVFLPVLLIPGVVGRFFAAFALTVCVCVFFSTIDALTVAPTLSALMMKNGVKEKPSWLKGIERFGKTILYAYEKFLYWATRRPKMIIASAGLIFIGSLILPKYIGFTFLPEDDSGEVEITIEATPGTTIFKTNDIALEISEILKTLPYIQKTSTRVGTEMNEENVAQIYVELVPEGQRSLTTSQMKLLINQNLDVLAKREGLSKTVSKPDSGGGQGKSIQLILTGPDNSKLTEISQNIVATAEEEIDGVVNFESNLKPGRDEWQLNVRRENLSAFGLDTQLLGRTLRGLYQGEIAGPFREDGEEYDIRVQLSETAKTDAMLLKTLTLTNRRQEEIPLASVVNPVMGKSPTKLVRIDQQRAARIQADLGPNAALGDMIQSLTSYVAPMLPEGYNMRFQGRAESLEDLRVGAIAAFFLGGLFIYMIMAALYESLLVPISILVTLPMAIVGAFLSLLIFGRFLDVYSVIGMILLMGLVAKNAIVLVDYTVQLVNKGMEPREAMIHAGVRRFRPIMMTVLSTVAGMMPIAMGLGELNKFRAGMGIAAIGGLLSSTILSLVVVPCLYLVLIKTKEKMGQRILNLKQRFVN